MKRITALLMAVIMMFVFVSCGDENKPETKEKEKTAVAENNEEKASAEEKKVEAEKEQPKVELYRFEAEDGKYGYKNRQDEIVIPAQFDYGMDFSPNGLAQVKVGEYWGFIDTTGAIVIEPKFYTTLPFGDGKLAGFLDEASGDWGFINEKGEVVIEPQYDVVREFAKNGLALVINVKSHGFINEKGEVAVPIELEYADSFTDHGLALVRVNEKYGWIDETGALVIDAVYDWASDFNKSGIAKVKIGDESFSINLQGKEV